MNPTVWFHQLTPVLMGLRPVIQVIALLSLSVPWIIRECGHLVVSRGAAKLTRAQAAGEQAQQARADRALDALLRTCETDPNRWAELAPLITALTVGDKAAVTFTVDGEIPARAAPDPPVTPLAGPRTRRDSPDAA